MSEIAAATERLLGALGTAVADGPDPFADPVARRAILASRAARRLARAARPSSRARA